MNCNDFLPTLETGSAFGRLRARVHARHCPQCRTVQRRLSELRSELARPSQLTAFHRRIWQRAALDVSHEPGKGMVRYRQLAIASCLGISATCVFVIALSLRSNLPPGEEGTMVQVEAPAKTSAVSIAVAPLDDIEDISVGLRRVAAELDRAAERASLLEARRAIADVAAMYPPLGQGDST